MSISRLLQGVRSCRSPSAYSVPDGPWSDQFYSGPDCYTGNDNNKIIRLCALVTACMIFIFLQLTLTSTAHAQGASPVFTPGDAVVTGFSGIRQSDTPLPPGGSPLDRFFIDLNGPSAQIKSLRSVQGAPEGQLVEAPVKLQIKASQTGQVFAVAIGERRGRKAPFIYLGATSYYGIQIVRPGAGEDSAPERLKKGEAGASFMDGQFGPEGGPGSIWRVDGETGEVKLFATLPDNSGPGIGDIVYDRTTGHLYVSDLDNGLIYRIDENGSIIDSFDHGVSGRPAKDLPELPDSGATMDIESSSFDSENPDTWGYTQRSRRVGGMSLRNGRLYYAVHGKHQVWSIGLNEDGSFSNDVQWEFDAQDLPGKGPITDMLFDKSGRIYLAQRGLSRGSYDYSIFAKPGKSSVTRYRRESPDDPSTESVWVPDRDEYAIGMAEDHTQSNGGIALGYAHDKTGGLKSNSCGSTLWTTGSRLNTSQLADEATDPEMDIHGLQGNAITLVRPENVPPTQSYFTDYDSMFGDASKAGHMGDVEIWQPCKGVTFTEYDPGFIPGDTPPDFPPDWIPPEDPFNTNLRLTKWASPKKCFFFAGKWRCRYRIRIRNTGPDAYFGPILVSDRLPTPLGSTLAFATPPGWSCWTVGAAKYRCGRLGAFLLPGQSVVITAYARIPASYRRCHLRNVAEILWAPGGTQWNTNPFDDIDSAVAKLPKSNCPDGKRTNLRLRKSASPVNCLKVGNSYHCRYRITVRNTGPGVYSGIIRIKDTTAAGTTLIGSAPGIWNCNLGTGVCQHPATVLLPGQAKSLWVWVKATIPVARQRDCKIRNRAFIQQAPGGSAMNTNPADDMDTAVANVPQHVCAPRLKSNLRLKKKALSEPCLRFGSNFYCRYRVRVRNTGPGTYVGSIKVRDNYLPGTTATFGASPQWNCTNLATPAHDCTYPFAIIPPGGFKDLLVTNRVPLHRARAYNCKIKNRARILLAPGGSNRNTIPGDDADDAIASIHPRYCAKTNLKIRKTAIPGTCLTGQNNGFFCKYKVEVSNAGPGVFHGQIKVKDTPVPGSLVNIQSGSWNCLGVICTHPTTTLHPGQKRSFKVTLRVTANFARQHDCKIRNRANITSPLGGTRNTFGGDDQSTAIASVPLTVCQVITPPPTPDCPPGWFWNPRTQECERPDTGGQPPLGTPQPKCPAGYQSISRSRIAGLKKQGWSVIRIGKRKWCGKPGRVTPPAVCPAGLKEIKASQARPLRSLGWTVIRTRQGLWCGKPGKPATCPAGMKKIPASQARSLRAKGRKVIRTKRGLWCARPGKPATCPAGLKKIPASRVRALRAQGWRVIRTKRGLWCGRPGKPATCPAGMKKVPASRARALRAQGWTVIRTKRGLWCGRPGKPRASNCPPGWRTVSGTQARRLKFQGWRVRNIGRGKWCARPGRVNPPKRIDPIKRINPPKRINPNIRRQTINPGLLRNRQLNKLN